MELDVRRGKVDWHLPLALLLVAACIASLTLDLSRVEKPFFVGSIVLGLMAIYKRQERPQLLLLGCLFAPGLFVLTAMLHLVNYLSPVTLDAALLGLDMGAAASIYRLVHPYPVIAGFLVLIYISLPVCAAFVLGHIETRFECARAMAMAGLIGCLFYIAVPAAGPAHLGDPSAPHNCFPSLHLTWAIMIAAYSPARLRPLSIVYAALIAVATLTTGEHYAIDLLAALPYAALILYAYSPQTAATYIADEDEFTQQIAA